MSEKKTGIDPSDAGSRDPSETSGIDRSEAVGVDRAALNRECSALSRYLVGLEPDAYLVEKYLHFHRARVGVGQETGFDRLCSRLMQRGPLGARLVDSYVSRFRRGGTGFAKLVVMLALLECRPASSDLLARPYAGSRFGVVLQLVLRGCLDGVSLLAATLLLGPAHLAQRSGIARE